MFRINLKINIPTNLDTSNIFLQLILCKTFIPCKLEEIGCTINNMLKDYKYHALNNNTAFFKKQIR